MDYRSIIESKYNREDWQSLLHDIFGRHIAFWSHPQPVEVNASMAKEALYTGKITLPDGYIIAIYEVELSDSVVIERNRAGIRNLLCANWRGMGCAGAFMFCFRKNEAALRFSYVSESFSFAPDGSLTKQSTDTKRFTYLLGEGHRCRTAIKQFEDLKNSSLKLKAITDAFSVEALSDIFFKEYKRHYEDIIEYITGKRMVKSGNKWVEKVTGNPCAEIMEEFSCFDDPEKTVRDYVKKLMGRLVFIQFLQKKGWMGCPAGEDWTNGDKEFVQNLFAKTQYKDTFVDDVLEPLFSDLNCKRTGDMATGANYKVPYLNGGLFEEDDSDRVDFPLPAKYMSDLLDFFACYNFTIDENDPDDAEIGIDPEMLGRIFENLLEDNKDKGAFYTPKEIVDYMCRESIIAYLQNGIPERSHELIRNFVETFDASQLAEKQKLFIRKKLQAVKICDPAIGSGAFPMGLVNLLSKLYVAMKSDTDTAKMKRHIMEQNIYGVDIEQGAVDIARLRFWLAMIVEEKEPMPLPNLHFKIMQGNSLLESYKGIDLSDLTKLSKDLKYGESRGFWDTEDSEREALISSLKSYYKTSDHSKRDRLFNDIINNVRRQLLDKNIILPAGKDPSANTDFFLWHTWFSDVFANGGFDIVIGNPPYGANIDELIPIYENTYPQTSKGYKDIYKYFFDQGLRILKSCGILSYITPSTFLRQPRYGDVRRLLLKYNILQILDLGEEIFEEAVVPVSVSLIKSSKDSSNTLFADLRSELSNNNVNKVLSNIIFDTIQQSYWDKTSNNSFIEVSNNNNVNVLLLEEILNFKDAGINYQRVKVGLSQKGKSDLSSRLLYEGEKEDDSHIMFWKGADIEGFFVSPETDRFVRPNISLASNERVILNADYFSISPKLIWRQTAPFPICAVDYRGIWFGRSIQGGTIKEKYQSSISYEYLCGLLNSSYIREKYEQAVREGGRVFPQVKLEKLKPLPIIIAETEIKQRIEELVRNIINLKSSNSDSTMLEQELNEIVANLYTYND